MNTVPSEAVDEIKSLLDLYGGFTADFKPFCSFSETAQYMLFTRSCNAFRSAGILCWEGLFVDSYNSARVGLEAGWLALILRRSDERAREWLTLVPTDTANSSPEKNYKSTFGSLPWIRKEVSCDESDLKRRTNIYQLLSTKSHANVSAMFFVSDSENRLNDVCPYPPVPLESAEHRRKFLDGILYCLKYMLQDIQRQCAKDFGVTWRYDNHSLFNIAGVAFPGGDDGITVVPEKVNSAYQSMILLKFAQVQAEAAR